MNTNPFNNIAIIASSIAITLNNSENLSLPRTLLIYPIVSCKDILKSLSDKRKTIYSLEQLIIENPAAFSNFNQRFLESLPFSINAIQLLLDTGIAELIDRNLKLKKSFFGSYGKRFSRIENASPHISKILSEPEDKIFSNLRIQL